VPFRDTKGAKVESKSKTELSSKSVPSDENNNNRKEDNNNRKVDTSTPVNGKRKRESGSTTEEPSAKKQSVAPRKSLTRPEITTPRQVPVIKSAQKPVVAKKGKDTTTGSQIPLPQRKQTVPITDGKTEKSKKIEEKTTVTKGGITKQNGDAKTQESQKSKRVSSSSESESDSDSVPGGAIVKTQKMPSGGSLQLEGVDDGLVTDTDDDDDDMMKRTGLSDYSQHPIKEKN